MSYIILHPHSNTNPSADYIVCDGTEWARYVNGIREHLPVTSRMDSYRDAEYKCDELNAGRGL